ncbi:MAG: iron-containing redox enzyme family protein, partial [Solirubrobacterales bacterium]|nr:iron-containing redox enzyme family protein [Solirubrobacterales bacterium]
MVVPAPRGPVSECLLTSLRRPLHRLDRLRAGTVVEEEDAQLALYCCYELHYRGLAGVDAEWEWEPSLLELRRALERRFESRLRDQIPTPDPVAAEDMDVALRAIDAADDGPPLSLHLQRHGTLD